MQPLIATLAIPNLEKINAIVSFPNGAYHRYYTKSTHQDCRFYLYSATYTGCTWCPNTHKSGHGVPIPNPFI